MRAGALLRLMRPPNIFTAFADSMAGLLVLRAAGYRVADADCLLIAASGLLYLGGMVLNDVFDREIDAVERPERPIPSGEVSAAYAALLGVGFVAGGVACAASVSAASAAIAGGLALCILLYDGGAKATALGPLAMGGCRTFNFALGLSPAIAAAIPLPPVAIAAPIVLGLYITGLTYIARDEVGGNTARRARTGLTFLAALAIAVVILLVVAPGVPASPWAWLYVAAALAYAYRNWSPLWERHDGPRTGRAIGGGLLFIPLFDATVCAVAGEPVWALAVLSLMGPALVLKTWFSPT